MSTSDHTHPDPRAWERWQTPPGVPDPGLLELLATDAAARATAMLAGDAAGQPQDPDPLIDAVRLLAGTAGAPHAARVAELTGVGEDDLRRLVLAYRHGGTAGVAAARAATPCDDADMAAAVGEVRRQRALAVGDLSVESGTITDPGAGVRLRRGPDGRWYPYTLARGQWWPARGAHAWAGTAYQTAVRTRSLRHPNA